jgi:molybdate transport system substrate-binding protein
MRKTLLHTLSSLVTLALFAATSSMGNAADIRVLGTKSAKLLIDAVKPTFEQKTGNRIVLTTDLPVATKRKIDAGEIFDVAILSPPLVTELVKEGKIAADTQADIVHVGIGLGVRDGAPVPDISTVDAFKQTLLNAKSIAYLKEGNTGVYMAKLVDKLGIAEQLKPKTILPMLDVVSELVAKGEAEVGLTAISLLLADPGVHTVGPIPKEIQFYITFTGGVSSHAQEPEAGRQLMKMLTSPEIATLIRSKGMEPPR